ncbi:hypothetical protein [Caballeronia udeis]|uniref:hypothetical protein n=1 Tax=Caballeronia udeis TaxID=1232866 RepID=UPI0012E846E4|nr:hypothetical protein [Caballeronia udeis]
MPNLGTSSAAGYICGSTRIVSVAKPIIDDELRALIDQCGTAKMGKDAMAVVDGTLKGQKSGPTYIMA